MPQAHLEPFGSYVERSMGFVVERTKERTPTLEVRFNNSVLGTVRIDENNEHGFIVRRLFDNGEGYDTTTRTVYAAVCFITSGFLRWIYRGADEIGDRSKNFDC